MLETVALVILVCVVLIIFYGIIVIHDIPYEIAKERNHPHQDAIHISGWVSLFTLHVLWPFLWIWATLWREDRGWGFTKLIEEQHDLEHKITLLSDQIATLQNQVSQLQNDKTTPKTMPAIEPSIQESNNTNQEQSN
ncbi:DUF3302 domain-containing protein [Vibrio sp. VB16]|uniref:DUF3302 domain-containing protein n=1 Tax=Vibrio sp. VB16 TaxID=2785746 RepID=UPI00189C7513|nr:DUF3302 domain-containing protein [Vibrio sp. VB16]UGA56524.1 DUF3302 domain-containing protein [Vibrio sp. VB16]